MKKDAAKVIPVAERIIEFDADHIRKNPSITDFSESLISEEDWREFAGNALVIMDGWDILQYAEEYPIVCYQCDKLSNIYLEGGPRLNSFIESITVSTAKYGKRVCFGSGKLTCELTDNDTVIYYTDNIGINHSVIQLDICDFLLQKPNLVVSPQGILIFFTDEQIIATVDCNHYHWIDGHVIDVEGKTIKDIEVWDDYCKVILIDDKKSEQFFSLKFDFDISAHQMLLPKATEL